MFVAGIYLFGGLDFVENHLTDWRFRIIERDASDTLVVVEIDPISLNEIDVWPLPRGLYAVALDKLLAAGADGVAINVDFSTSSSSAEDKMLQLSLAQSRGKVILPIFKQPAEGTDGGREYIISLPIQQFREHAQLAFINVQPETDGLIRRMSVRESWNKQTFPSLSFALTKATDFEFNSFFIDYGIRKDSIPRISFVDILRGTFDKSTITGKQVIIGVTAVELGNQLAVPVHYATSGTLIQAIAYESLAQKRALLPLAPTPVLILTFLLALFLAPRFKEWSWRRGLAIVILTSAPLFSLALVAQYLTPVLIDITPLILLISISYGVALVHRIDQQAVGLMFQGIEIRRRDMMMRNVVENSFDGIITIDDKGIIESINPAALGLFEYSSENILGQHMGMIFSGLREESEGKELFDFLRIGQGSHDIEGRSSNGRIFPGEVEVTEIQMDDRRVLTAFIRDITERSNLKAELEHHALHDTLTDLPNRTLFFDRLDRAIISARRSRHSLAVLLIDLNRFKGVNDTFGHHIGDLLLKQVSQRLQCLIRESDTIARLGGDEYVVLLPEIKNTDIACRLSVKLLNALEQRFELNEYSLEITASIGIAVFPDHGEDAKILIQNADVAMYLAKQEHTGFTIYSADKNQHKAHKLMLVNDLRHAIEEDQLVLHYQPKIDLGSAQVCGVEALVRWPHQKHGLLQPAEFIDLAEQTGLIKSLTLWVLDKTLAQCAKWHEDGAKISVSVNFSALCLQDLTLPEAVDKLISKWNLPANCLTLEITESAVMIDPIRGMKAVKFLKGCGIRISIDDFGTGYSSLAYLNNLSADELKIDKSFVLRMTEDKSNKMIVESTIGLAHNLGMLVVAEGIENVETSEILSTLGCDLGQGYLFCRPLSLEDLNVWLMESQKNLKPGLMGNEIVANKLII